MCVIFTIIAYICICLRIKWGQNRLFSCWIVDYFRPFLWATPQITMNLSFMREKRPPGGGDDEIMELTSCFCHVQPIISLTHNNQNIHYFTKSKTTVKTNAKKNVRMFSVHIYYTEFAGIFHKGNFHFVVFHFFRLFLVRKGICFKYSSYFGSCQSNLLLVTRIIIIDFLFIT